MKRPTTQQLDAYLERVVNRLRDLRQLNLSAEAGIHQALEESQNLLASIAMYRHQLKTIARTTQLENLGA